MLRMPSRFNRDFDNEGTVKPLISVASNPKTQMFLVSPCTCLYPIHWSQVLGWEWRYSWISADQRCSNFIWVITNYIAYEGVFILHVWRNLIYIINIMACADLAMPWYWPILPELHGPRPVSVNNMIRCHVFLKYHGTLLVNNLSSSIL